MKPTRFWFLVFFLFPILLNGQICGDISITQHPLSTAVCNGLSATFSVVGSGANLTYQWRKNGVNIANATSSSFSITTVSASDAGNYDCVLSNATCPSSISNIAALTINALPPAPYVGGAHAACGCESATAKAQHRDPVTFQPLPNKNIVWYSDSKHEKALLPSTVDGNNISLCNSSTFPPILAPLTSIYAFEIENGCYSPPALVNITAFALPTTLPKVFQDNTELQNFATLRSCEPITLTATPSVSGGLVSWYASSNRGQLLGTGPTYTATTSGAVFVFDAPQNNTCSTGDVLTCYGIPKQINVIILPKPVIDLGADLVQCKAGDVKNITSTVTNTNIPFEYLWSTGATSTSISVSTPNSYSLSVTNISIINNVLFRCTSSDTVVVSLSNLAVSAGADIATCAATTTITPTVTGGKAPFTYKWTGGQTTAAITVGAGTYSVTVTDANDCTASDEVVVSNSANLTVSAGADVATCAATTTLTSTVSGGTAPFSYKWSGGQLTPSVTVGAGTYRVTVSDANGCSGSDEVIVTNSANLTVSAGADVATCAATTTLTSTVSGGTAPFSYKWSGGQLTPSVTVGAGTYRVTVSDANGCSGSDEVIVTNSANLTVSAGADVATCAATTTLTSTVSGGTAPFSYKWSGGQLTPSVTVGAGTYRVTVSDANGCSGSDEVIVTNSANLTVSAGADVATCAATTTLTSTVSGGTAPFSYKWSGGQLTPSVTVGAGTYRVTVSDANGCSGSDEVIVTNSANLTVSAGADVATCAATTTLTSTVSGGTAPFSYKWSGGQLTPSVTVGAGTYRVSVSDANGCSGSDEVIVTNSANLTVSAGADVATCAATTTLTPTVSGGTAPFSYKWSGGQLTPSVTVGAGTYRVTVSDANGCSGSDEVIVTTGNGNGLNASIRQKNNTCNGGKDGQIFITVPSGTGPFSYSIDNGTTWSSNENYYTLISGDYKVIVRASSGCTYTQTITITEPQAITFSTVSVNSSCTSSSGSIKVENMAGGNGAPYQYSINYGTNWQSANTFTNLSSGTFYVRVRDANLCQSIVIKPTVVGTPQAITFKTTTAKGACGEGETITISNVEGGLAPYQYSCDGGRTWQRSPVFPDNSAGVYALKVRDANLCTSNIQSVQVTQNPLYVTVKQKDNLCYGATNGQILINALAGTMPYSYSINDGAKWVSTSNFYELAAGTYKVKVKDGAGCTFSKTITLTQGDKITFTATATAVSCKKEDDGKITFSAVSGGSNNGNNYRYSIDYGQNWQKDRNFNKLEAGVYNTRVQDAAGCNSAIQKIEVTKAASISFETTVQNVTCGSNSNGIIGVSNVRGGEAPYKYSKTGGNSNTYGTSYQPSNSFLFLQAGNYSIRVKDNNGCESAVKNVVVAKNCNNSNSLQQTNIVQKIPVVIYGIAPNPSDDYIRIELNSLKAREQEFQFFDAFGKPILTEKRLLDEGVQRVEFDITNLPQGVYEVITPGSYGKNTHNRFVKI